ncbi:MAG: histone deacetylase [Acidobacteriota bacterium]
MRYGIVVDPVFVRHAPPPGHPERPDRIRSLLQALESWEKRSALQVFAPTPVDPSLLGRIHSEALLEQIRNTAGRDRSQIDPDTYASARSYEVALLAAGGVVDLTSRLLDGEIETGFALIRPPGHHAESERAMGFCLFNNVALAAEFALASKGIDKVAIVDFDVHHGNGTQQIFYERPDLLYISTHQYPLYPGSGDWNETGRGAGRGFSVNFPLPAGMGNTFYVSLFQDFILPIVRSFAPDLVLVSAGYDAHREDPLAGMNLDERGFGAIAHLLNSTAREVCGGRLLYVLEGGYQLDALTRSVLATIEVSLSPSPVEIDGQESSAYRLYRQSARAHLSESWNLFDN